MEEDERLLSPSYSYVSCEVGSAKILTLDSETIEVTFMSNIFNVIGISSITIY